MSRPSGSNRIQIDPNLSLPQAWFSRTPDEVARDLLGCLLVSTHDEQLTVGIIVETEAYGGADDPASHASFRRNGLVQAMWGPPGTAYVYRAYGVYPCLNVVTGTEGRPSAVLLRAAEPLVGIDVMAVRLNKPVGTRLASGPGLLGRAFGASIADNGHVLSRPPLWLQAGDLPEAVVAGPRIGISRGLERHWRFGVAGHPALSRAFPKHRQPE